MTINRLHSREAATHRGHAAHAAVIVEHFAKLSALLAFRGELAHHLLGLLKLFDQAVDLFNGSARACGDTAQVQISDNGPGIPDAEKSKIFEKFYRGGNRIADNRRSLGLGLYLCKAITEAHGGSITVADNSPTGAVFTVTLPKEEVLLNEVVSDPGR